MPRQIAAIHGGDVSRIQRPEIARIVPIIEMAAKALQAAHRCQGCFQALDGLGRTRPAEVAGADRGKKVEPEICLLYTSDAADDLLCVDLGGRRIIKKKKKT